MNKLLFREGGQPFYLDDLDFMQSAFADTVKGIVSTYGNVILSGCNVPPPISIAGRPTTYNWEEGYIAINGEVYRVEEGSFEGGMNASLYWKVVSTEGQKEIYENTSENNVYQYRKVELTDTVTSSDIYVSASAIKSMNNYLMIYEEKEIRAKAASNIPEDSLSFKVFKSNQGFDIVIINFRALKAISGSTSPWVYYDYYEADGKPQIVVRNDNQTAIHTFQLVRGAALIYDISKGEAIRDFPEGFSYRVQFLLKK